MKKQKRINFTLNGERISTSFKPGESALDIIRERMGITAVKQGCDGEGCGACTVIVDDRAVYSCMMPSFRLNGRRVETAENIPITGDKNHIQKNFMENWAFQCGYCTPGFVNAIESMVREARDNGEINTNFNGNLDDFVKDGLNGHICRCTGYLPIIDSAKKSIKDSIKLQGESSNNQDNMDASDERENVIT